MSLIRTGARLAAALLATLCGHALAQSEQVMPEVKVQGNAERADGPVQGYRATRSSTFTRTDTPLSEVPASVTVVPESLMRDAAMQGMSDVFRYVPGVSWHQGEGNRDQMVIRGNSTTADFYVDSVRDDAQVFRDLYNLERVEFLKGPAGMIFGRGGAGGVVNRVTKKPVFDHVGGASVTLGSYAQKRGTVDLGNKWNEGAAWRLNAMIEESNSFRRGVDLSRYAFNPTVTFALGSSSAFTLGFEHLYDERTADRGFPSASGLPVGADRSQFFGNAGQSRAHSQVDGLYGILDHDLGSGLQLRNTTRLTYYDKYYQNVFPGSAVANGTLALSAYNNANERTNLFNQTDLTRTVRAGGLEHGLLAGVELGWQDSANKRNTGFFGPSTSIAVPASDPFAIATSFRPNGTDADNEVRSTIAAVYVQDQVTLSPHWKAIAGLRYDRFAVNFDDRRITTPATDLSRTDNGVSPRFGMIWTPAPGSMYYASYSFAFLPSAEQLSLATSTADLGPEKARNYEIGARWDLSRALTLSAAIFRTQRDDVRVADPLNPGLFVKTGQQRTDGIEIGLQGDVTPRWQVYGGYAYLDGRVTKAVSTGTTANAGSIVPEGNRIGLVPEHTFSLWNKVRLRDKWAAGLGLIYQSSSYTSFTNTVKLPAYGRVDTAVYYDVDRKNRLALNVENLLDREYFPTADGDNNITPGAPLMIRLTWLAAF
jgi:catecholate siderophore receptor